MDFLGIVYDFIGPLYFNIGEYSDLYSLNRYLWVTDIKLHRTIHFTDILHIGI
jgi:hypothetical protein